MSRIIRTVNRVGRRGLAAFVITLAAVNAMAACGGPAPTPTSSLTPVSVWAGFDVGEPVRQDSIGRPFGSVTSGVAYGDGFALVGLSADGTGPSGGAVWSTRDGTTWTRFEDPGRMFERMYPARVGTDGERLVALGWRSPWDERRGAYVAWVSDDGAKWERHDVEATALGGIYAEGIVGSPAGFIAWGGRADQHTALLWSADGLDWQAIDYPGAADGDIFDVAPYGAGFVAVGANHEDDDVIGGPSESARAWFSPDGRRWESAAVPNGWSLFGVYPAARGLYALGAQDCSRCVGPDLGWQSPDGRSWSRAGNPLEHQGFLGSNGSVVAAFAWQDDRAISLSADGIEWHKVVANLPRADEDHGLIVGSIGVLLLVGTSRVIDGVQHTEDGVLFLRGE